MIDHRAVKHPVETETVDGEGRWMNVFVRSARLGASQGGLARGDSWRSSIPSAVSGWEICDGGSDPRGAAGRSSTEKLGERKYGRVV